MRRSWIARKLSIAASLLGPHALALVPTFVPRALADTLHCESQVRSSGHLAIEERGYELFFEPGRSGQSQVRLRVTYFNSSSQPLDLVSQLALPAHAELQGLSVRGDHGWVPGAVTQKAKDAQSQAPGFYARIVESSPSAQMRIAELVGIDLPGQAYVSVELLLSVPVQRLMDKARLCLPPRMVQGAGLMRERRISLRDHQGKAKSFWVDGTPVSAQGMALRANDKSCLAWKSPGRNTPGLQVDFVRFYPKDGANHFSINIGLGPQSSPRPQALSVMLDRSSSVESSTFRGGVALFQRLQAQSAKPGKLWVFDRRAHPVLNPSQVARKRDLAGSNLVAALRDWLDQGGARSHSEALVVVTDGLLPLPEDQASIDELEKKLRRRKRAQITILVDDPVLAQQGLRPGHPLLALAARIGARLSLQSLGPQLDAATLLASPKVAKSVKVRLPRGCRLHAPPPQQLIAGQTQRVFGQCSRRVKRPWVQVRATQGQRTKSTRAKAPPLAAHASHWASASSQEAQVVAAKAGHPRPTWFSRAMEHQAELSFEAASQIREKQGHLDAELLQHRLREFLWPRAHACYNRALGRSRKQTGVAELAIALGKGEVSLVKARSVSLKVRDPAFLDCLEKAAWKVRVPAGLMDPVVYRVYYPLRFHRPKNADVGEVSAEDQLRYEWLLGRGEKPAS